MITKNGFIQYSIITLVCLLSTFHILAQPCNSITLISCGNANTFVVPAGTGDANYPNGMGTSMYANYGVGGLEKIYKFIAPASGIYQFSTTTSATNYVEYFYLNASNICGSTGWTGIGYTSSATNLNSFVLNANDSIYILANAESASGVSQSFQINCSSSLACDNISNISCGVSNTFSATIGYGDPAFSNGMSTSCYNSYGKGGLEKIYKFTAPATGLYQISTTTATNNGSYVEYFYKAASAGCSSTGWNCMGNTTSAVALYSLVLNAGDSIFILANAESNSGATQSFIINCALPAPCNTVTTINCGVPVSFSVGGGYGDPAYPNGVNTSCYNSSGKGGLEKIYKFIVPSTGLYQFATTTATNNGSYVEYFYSNAAGNCSSNSWTCLGNTTSASALNSLLLSAGDSIFILANAESTYGVSQSFTISCGIPDVCFGITDITCGTAVNYNVTAGYGNPGYPNGANTSCYNSSGRGGLEKIYKFKATTAGLYQFSTTTASNNGSYVEYFYTNAANAANGCGTTNWTCLGYTSSATALNSLVLNAGDSILILVNAESTSGVSQSFIVSCAIPPACNNITTVTCGTATNFLIGAGYGDPYYPNGLNTACYNSSGKGGLEKIYKFTAAVTGLYQFSTTTATNNSSYVEYFYTSAANGCSASNWTCIGYTASAIPLTSLLLNAGDSIFILVNAESTAGVSQSFLVTCGATVACKNVTSISCGSAINFNVTSGYGDPNFSNGLNTSCYNSSGRGGLEKMYRFIATTTGLYQINTTTVSSNSSVVEYFYTRSSDICNNTVWTCIGYTASAIPLNSMILNSGDTIYILVNAESTAGVSQSFQINCAQASVCNNITSLSCGTINSFSVTAGYGDPSFINGAGTSCYANSGKGGLEKIYRFVANSTGYYGLETTTSSSNSSYIEYLYKKGNNCSNTGWSCFGYTTSVKKMDSVYLAYHDTLLILVNAESTAGVSQSFRLNCARNLCTALPSSIPNSFVTVYGCDNVVYKGITYTKTTTISDTLKTKNGCDSVYLQVLINVTKAFVLNPVVTATNSNICSDTKVTFTASPSKLPLTLPWPYTGHLYLISDATGWANPVNTPTQEFQRTDSVTYTGIFDLTANCNYKLLPENGSWSHSYSLDVSKAYTALSGYIIYDGNNNFTGPATKGKYMISINFRTGKYTVQSYTQVLPDSLYLVGSATAGGWQNPVPTPSQKFTRVNSALFEITLPVIGGGQYFWIPVNGSWINKFAVANGALSGLENGGTFGYNFTDNIPAPSTSGIYKLSVDFSNYTFKVTPDILINKTDTAAIYYQYQWYKNGLAVGENAVGYIDSALQNSDSVWCVLTSTATCTNNNVVKSNVVNMIVREKSYVYASATVCLNQLPYIWSGTTYNAAGTYYANYTNKAGCDSFVTFKLVVDSVLPSVSVTASGACKGATLTAISNTNLSQIIWQHNGINLNTQSAVYPANGTTVAGGNVTGFGSNTFNGPTGIFVDKKKNMYIVDQNNQRVQKWTVGATSAVTVAGGNGYSTSDKSLEAPTGVAVDEDNNVYVADFSNHRIMKWAPGATTGILVAGGNGVGSGANQINGAGDVCLDAVGNLYICDQNNHRVQRWAPGAKYGVTVAGGNGAGAAANQLNTPAGLFVDKMGNVYVSDFYNRRVQKWAVGATTGVTVAGGNGAGPAANQLDNPAGIFVDGLGSVYVADVNNQRIQKWAVGATTGVTVAGGNGTGSSPNQINKPADVFIDTAGILYVADRYNQRIQSWTPGINGTFIPDSAGTFSATVINNSGCSSTSNLDTIYSKDLPTISIKADLVNLCYGPKTTFNATSTNGGSAPVYQWVKNHLNVGMNSSTYTDTTLVTGDSIWCVLTSNSPCVNTHLVYSDTIAPIVKYIISGNIFHPAKKYIFPGVTTYLTGSTLDSAKIVGKYQFNCLLDTGNYLVKLNKQNEKNKANGITTLDIALIQSHILGKNKLNSPYKLIAADVNGDGKVTTLDIVYLKRLILGLDTTFTKTSTGEKRLWAFVDSCYQFPDTTNPFPFKDSISYIGLSANKINQTFIGVKLGDVNWDWNPALAKMPSKVFVRPKKLLIE